MNYSEIISQIANNLLVSFDEVYFDCEIVTNDKNERFPAITLGDEWISLVPTDEKETLYIRRNGNDEVLEELRLSSCGKAYRMRTPLRTVYFKDHVENRGEFIFKLMQATLTGNTKLKSISRDKWKLLKEESSGAYNFGATTVYFAIDIYAMWDLVPDNCEYDFCADIINPLKKESCPAAVNES